MEFRPARKGYMGLTHLQQRRIEVFVRSCDVQSDDLLRHVMAHELGHAYDTARMAGSTRQAWLAARGISGRATGTAAAAAPTSRRRPATSPRCTRSGPAARSSNRSEIAGDASGRRSSPTLAARFFGA